MFNKSCKRFVFIIIIVAMFLMNSLYSDDYKQLREQGKSVLLTHYHDILKSFAGSYRQIFFFTPPDARPENGSGSSVNTIILDERFLEINSKLKMGKDILQRKTVIGYDGIAEKYTLTQYSNYETFPMTATGKFDPDEKSIVFRGNYPYEALNAASFMIVLKYDNHEEFTYTFYEIEDEVESKILEIKNFKISE
ncbi:MAG: DUF1579 family protein [Candidatus Kapaibacterium sp.]